MSEWMHSSEDKFEEAHAQMMHCKKSLAIFPSPAGMSLIKLSLAGNNLSSSSPRKQRWAIFISIILKQVIYRFFTYLECYQSFEIIILSFL